MSLSRIEKLTRAYERHIGTPWQRTLAGAQRVVFVVYEKELERTLRSRARDFGAATRDAGHGWTLVDCTSWFADWMADDDYREAYFEDPSLLDLKLESEFRSKSAQMLCAALEEAGHDDVVALLGVASLYGFLRVSDLIRSVEPAIKGRLVVFFPGSRTENNFRLLDARDGWNYLAQPITWHDAVTLRDERAPLR